MASIKLSVDEDGDIVIENAFNGVLLKSTDGEKFGICMRDGGFEFSYNNIWYSAVNGQIKQLGMTGESPQETDNATANDII